MNYKEQLERYIPYNEQEENDKKIMLEYINNFDNILTRDNEFAHFTASAWVLNKQRDKVLMIYHNIYNSWAWTGGHADGDIDLLGTAIREVKEETGIKEVVPIINDIFSIEILCVDGHVKRGKYVSSHVHLNLTYLLEASEEEILSIKEDENSDVKWIDLEDVKKFSKEKWMIKVIYSKLNEKLKKL